MSKEESKILKGIAILMMLFLHLFNHNPDGVVIPHLLKLCDPVDLFLVLGGYGMYKVWQKGDKNRWGRALRLLTHYWLILAIFLTLGHMIKPQTYPGSFKLLVLNALTVKYSYNGEMWFLFPYICLSLLSPYIFTVCKRIRVRYILAATAVLGLGTSFIISRYGAQYLFNNDLLYDPFLIIHLMPSFLLGAMAARCNVFERIPRLQGGAAILLLIVLLITKAFVHSFYIHGLYAFLFIFLFLKIKHFGWASKVLVELGNKSMEMWMIHTWFCYYLFHDWIYSFKYPILIFIVLVAVSYCSAAVVQLICRLAQKGMKKIFAK